MIQVRLQAGGNGSSVINILKTIAEELNAYALDSSQAIVGLQSIALTPAVTQVLFPLFSVVTAYKVILRNVSTAGQTIGLGADPTLPVVLTMATAQILLYPGEMIELDQINTLLTATSDIAGAQMRIMILRRL